MGPTPSIARMTAEEYRAHLERIKAPSKFRAKRTNVAGISFASAAEGRRYAELKILADKGEIHELALQPKYELIVDGTKVGSYIADFSYVTKDGAPVVEDVKGVATPLYKFKKKLFEALYKGLKVTEIKKGSGNGRARKTGRGDVA